MANACLVCCEGYDGAEAAIDLMDDTQAAVHAAHRYVRGGTAQPTPSIATLNAHTAQLAIQALLGLVQNGSSSSWDRAWFDAIGGATTVARIRRRADCPLFGVEGVLAIGVELAQLAPALVPTLSSISKEPIGADWPRT